MLESLCVPDSVSSFHGAGREGPLSETVTTAAHGSESALSSSCAIISLQLCVIKRKTLRARRFSLLTKYEIEDASLLACYAMSVICATKPTRCNILLSIYFDNYNLYMFPAGLLLIIRRYLCVYIAVG